MFFLSLKVVHQYSQHHFTVVWTFRSTLFPPQLFSLESEQLGSAQLFYAKHNPVAVSPLKSWTSSKLLDALIKMGKKDPKPLIHNVGSMVKVCFSESEEINCR
jgi:hypothetical protein